MRREEVLFLNRVGRKIKHKNWHKKHKTDRDKLRRSKWWKPNEEDADRMESLELGLIVGCGDIDEDSYELFRNTFEETSDEANNN